jgi:hypothetical protein
VGLGLTVGTPAAHAAGPCALANAFLDVGNDAPRPSQASHGEWHDVDDPSVVRPWYGLFSAPLAPMGDAFQWRFSADCLGGSASTFKGHARGSCDTFTGTGTDAAGRSVTLTSVGSVVVFTGPAATGVAQVSLSPPTDTSCLRGDATHFAARGVLVV